MDTVSMLNTMSFYCQPILPLVYDESMSYYETLCKVVGQLNITGETVNKICTLSLQISCKLVTVS